MSDTSNSTEGSAEPLLECDGLFLQLRSSRSAVYGWVAATLVVFAYLCIALTTTNLQYHSAGDAQGEMVVIVGGKKFAEEGFLTHALTPKIPSKGPDFSTRPGEYYFYSHFPSLSFYVYGLMWKLGLHAYGYYKVIQILFCAAFLLALYGVFERLLNPGAAVASVAVILASRVLYTQAQATPVNMADFFWALGLLFLVAALLSRKRGDGGGWRLLGAAWICYLLNSLSSFEYILSFGFLTFALSLVIAGRKGIVPILMLATAPFLAQAFHFATNAWAFGGIEPAVNDLRNAFAGRTVGNETYSTSPVEKIGGLSQYPGWLAATVARLFHVRIWAVGAAAGGLAALAAMDRRVRRDIGWFILVFGCIAFANATFCLLFPQLTIVHINSAVVGRNWIPFFGLLHGGVLYLLVFAHRAVPGGYRRLAALIVGVLAAAPGVYALAQSAAETKQTLRYSRTGQFEQEFNAIQDAAPYLRDQPIILTTDKQLARLAYFLQPRESFGLPEFSTQVVYDPKSLRATYEEFSGDSPVLLLAPYRPVDADPGFWTRTLFGAKPRGFTRLRVCGNAYAADELFPTQTAASDSTIEGDSTEPLTPTYGARLETVPAPTGPGKEPGSQHALRIASRGVSKSGVQLRPEIPLRLARGRTYVLHWRVWSESTLPDLRFGIREGETLRWTSNPATRAFQFENEPGAWSTFTTTFRAGDTNGAANIFIHCNEPVEAVWYIDDVRIGEAGGYVLAQLDALPEGFGTD